MTRLIIASAIGAFWIGAYLVGGWWGVGIMAAVGFVAELILFGISALQSDTDHDTAQRRWRRWRQADALRFILGSRNRG